MTSEEQAVVDRGKMLEALKIHPGWKIIVGILDETVQIQMEELMNCASSDPDILRAKLNLARCMKQIKSNIDLTMESSIAEAREILKQIAISEAIQL